MAFILSYREITIFILEFEIVQLEYITLNLWQSKIRFLIYFKNLFIKQNSSLEKNLSTYILILKNNLLIKSLKNIQPRKMLNRNLIYLIFLSKREKQNTSIIL